MLSSKDYVKKLKQRCEPLFQFSEGRVKSFFESNPSTEDLIEYFVPRMVNERGNCIGVARRVANLPDNTSPEEMWTLCKHAMDEARHFRIGVEIVEHLTGGPVDFESHIARIKERNKTGVVGPSQLMDKYESADDPLAQALYNFIGEGRASRNWTMIAKTASDSFLAAKYMEIARDEKFHANIGKRKLEELCVDQETQDRCDALAEEFINDLYAISVAKYIKLRPEMFDMNGCVKQHYPASAM